VSESRLSKQSTEFCTGGELGTLLISVLSYSTTGKLPWGNEEGVEIE
jgi:hypothetical protein